MGCIQGAGESEGTAVQQVTVPRTVLPVIDASMKARLRSVFLAGRSAGNSAAVFSKVGDELTATGAFMDDLGCRDETIGAYAALTPTIDYFRTVTFAASRTGAWCGTANSFSLRSAAADQGWTAARSLVPYSRAPADCPSPYNTPLRCELHRTRPAAALIMFGTYDLMASAEPASFRLSLSRVVADTLAAGVIPVLSTIPPRRDNATYNARVPAYNDAIIALASEQRVPLWDYHVALNGSSMVNQGMTSGGFYPSVGGGSAAAFTTTGLRYGYNQRNLTAVQVLGHLKAVVYDDGPADSSGSSDAGSPTDVRDASDVVDARDVVDVVDASDVVDVVDASDVVDVVDSGAADAGTTTDSGTADNVSYSGSLRVVSGRSRQSLQVAGISRPMTVYLPSSRISAPPLVMAFHGTGGNGDQVFDESGAQAMANSHGVVVIAPDSQWMSGGDWDHPSESGYWQTWPDVDPNHNVDLLLVRAIMVEAQRRFGVDAHRIYSIGHSNGAFFAQLVATQMATRIAGYGSSSGGLVQCATTQSCHFQGHGTTCDALRTQPGWCGCTGADKPGPVPTSGRIPPAYLAHGTTDPMVSVQYTCALSDRMRAANATSVVVLRDGDGHVLPSTFASDAWAFLSAYRLP